MAKPVDLIEAAKKFVKENVEVHFHNKLHDNLLALKLNKLLKRKNPYLFKAKAIQSATDLIPRILDAHLSSQEETVFGKFLELLAIHICGIAFGGVKSASEGIDLEFQRNSKRYIVAIKSGPKWANSSQIKRMKANFAQAQRITGPGVLTPVNGCCYGQERNQNKLTYYKICGQDFWELISGDKDLYRQIIVPLGVDAKRRTEEFQEKYNNAKTLFTKKFIQDYCKEDGSIDWDKLVVFNSASLPPRVPKAKKPKAEKKPKKGK